MECNAPTTDWYFMKIIEMHDIRVHNCVLNTNVWEPSVFVDDVCCKTRTKVLGYTGLVEFRMFLCGDFEFFGVRNRRDHDRRVRFVGANYILFRLYRGMGAVLCSVERGQYVSAYIHLIAEIKIYSPKCQWLPPSLKKQQRFSRNLFGLIFSIYFSQRFRAVSAQVYTAFSVAVTVARGQHT